MQLKKMYSLVLHIKKSITKKKNEIFLKIWLNLKGYNDKICCQLENIFQSRRCESIYLHVSVYIVSDRRYMQTRTAATHNDRPAKTININ